MRFQPCYTLHMAPIGNRCSKESHVVGKSTLASSLHFLLFLALPEHHALALQPCKALGAGPPMSMLLHGGTLDQAQRLMCRRTEWGLTGESDVETPLPCGVVSLELETGHVAAACDGRGELVS